VQRVRHVLRKKREARKEHEQAHATGQEEAAQPGRVLPPREALRLIHSGPFFNETDDGSGQG
jgi:hypothetical protein